MGFWPFGRERPDIETASRVVTAAAQNGYKVRGRLVLHFEEPQRQADADDAADQCAAMAEALLREAPDHERLIGAEAQLSAQLLARYPSTAARARAVELAALHVVGDPTLSDELRRASSIAPPSSVAPRSMPPSGLPSAGPPSSLAPSKRRPSSQIRAVKALSLAPGATPTDAALFLAPMAKDASARLLIGYLRAHDLVTLRGVAIDEGSAELLANLVPASDAPLGGYEASRAGEIARWQTTLGVDVMNALHREADVVTTYLARDAMLRAEVPPPYALAVIEGLTISTFSGGRAIAHDLVRFPSAIGSAFVPTVAENLARVAGAGDDWHALAPALAPLVETIQEDLNVTARIIKHAATGQI